MTGSPYVIPASDLLGIYPELILAGAGVAILLIDAFIGHRRLLHTLLGIAAVAASAYFALCAPGGESFGGLLDTSTLAAGARWVILLSVGLSILGSHGYLQREGLSPGEYLALLLWAGVGAMLFARSTELITLFVGLELLSVCLYALAGYHRKVSISTEAGIKYFLIGAVMSAFLLLGIALVYGTTGTTTLTAIAPLGGGQIVSPMTLTGLLLLLCGLAFKMGLVPFHAWAPDAYQGAPSPFVAFLSVAPKAAAAVALVRVTAVAVDGYVQNWDDLLAGLAILSMLVGNLLALSQRDIKRMLAYSGVAHMGYLLVPLVGLSDRTDEAVLVYLLAYALMNAGAFIVVARLFPEPGEQHLISDLGGWGYRYPLYSLALTVCMLSLGGIPPTLGFIGKYLIFVHAFETAHLLLAISIVVTSLVGVFYYLRVVYTLYMKSEVRTPSDDWLGQRDLGASVAVVVASALTVVLGLWPTGVLSYIGSTLGRGS